MESDNIPGPELHGSRDEGKPIPFLTEERWKSNRYTLELLIIARLDLLVSSLSRNTTASRLFLRIYETVAPQVCSWASDQLEIFECLLIYTTLFLSLAFTWYSMIVTSWFFFKKIFKHMLPLIYDLLEKILMIECLLRKFWNPHKMDRLYIPDDYIVFRVLDFLDSSLYHISSRILGSTVLLCMIWSFWPLISSKNSILKFPYIIWLAYEIRIFLAQKKFKVIFKRSIQGTILNLNHPITFTCLLQNNISRNTLSLVLIIYHLVRPFQTKGEPKRRRANTQDCQDIKRLFKEQKKKRGINGFINGISVIAIADTGAAQNVISREYARKMGLSLTASTYQFKLGNRKTISSMDTCHVLQSCIYDVILGHEFLTQTDSLVDYRKRLTECLFSVPRAFQFGFLGETCKRVEGRLGTHNNVLALPDSGAERNVIDFHYAIQLGLTIDKSSQARNYLQFADGSYQQTSGQIHTNWTFANGKTVPITFEVLKRCAANVVIGEQVIYETNMFAEYAGSMKRVEIEKPEAPFQLAPFGFVNKFEKKFERARRLMCFKRRDVTERTDEREYGEEMKRREDWNLVTDFGLRVDEEARQLERAKREKFDRGGVS